MNHPPDVNAVPGLSSTLDDGSSQKPDHTARGGTSTLACPENPTQLMGRLLDRTSQPFAAIDFEGRITSANRAFEKLTGYTVAELLTMTIGDLTPEPWKVKMDETLVRVQSTGKSERYEKEYRRRDGTSILVEVAVDLDRDEKNRPVGYFAFVTDISERKKVENALRESEERFRRLYDEAPVGYHEIDTEGRIVNINRTECEMLGYTREEVLGRSVFDFVAEETREPALRAFPDKIQGKTPLRTLERTFVTRDGRRLLVSIEERYKRDEQGQIVGIRSTVQDITERKRTEAALVASERRARALFEGIEDAVFVHAPDGRILDANPAASRLLGYTQEELLRMTTNDIDDPEFAAGYEDRLKSQLTQGHLSCEGRHRTKDGRVIPVEINTLDDHLRRPAGRPGRHPRHHRAPGAGGDPPPVRRGADAERPRDGGQEPRADRVGGALPPAHRGLPRRRRGRRPPGPDHPVQPRRREDLRLPGRRDPGSAHHSADPRRRSARAAATASSTASRPATPTWSARPSRSGASARRARSSRSSSRSAASNWPASSSSSARSATRPSGSGCRRCWRSRRSWPRSACSAPAWRTRSTIRWPTSANNLAVLERDLKGVLEMIALYESACDALGRRHPRRARRGSTRWATTSTGPTSATTSRMHSGPDPRGGPARRQHRPEPPEPGAHVPPQDSSPSSIADLFESALEMVRGRMRSHHIELVVEHGQLPRVDCVPSQISQVILNLLINAVQAIESHGPQGGGTIRFSSQCEGGEVILCDLR